jgi:hypothetical protein
LRDGLTFYSIIIYRIVWVRGPQVVNTVVHNSTSDFLLGEMCKQ